MCPYEETTRRSDMQQIFQQLEQLNPEARYSLWRAMNQKATYGGLKVNAKGESLLVGLYDKDFLLIKPDR